MRLFCAIELDAAARALLAGWAARLARSGLDVKWVEAHNLHLTVKFLGEVDDEVVGIVADDLEAAAAPASPFELRPAAPGAFPSPARPRVIYAGLDAPGALFRLQADIEDACAALGFEREARRFQAHVTLGRVRTARRGGRRGGKGQRGRTERAAARAAPGAASEDAAGRDAARALAALQAEVTGHPAPPFEVRHLTLLRSQLARTGPTYSPVRLLPLRGSAAPDADAG